MATRGRPKAPGMVQICFRVPSDVAEFIREMSVTNDRQPGAELARMLRPLIEVEKKRRAWEQQQQAPLRKLDDAERPGAKRSRKKGEQGQSPSHSAEPDLFGKATIDPTSSQA